jgi:hypothetical protein
MTEIKYKNAILVRLEAGKVLTLHCADRKLDGDIAVIAPEDVEEWDGTIRDALPVATLKLKDGSVVTDSVGLRITIKEEI